MTSLMKLMVSGPPVLALIASFLPLSKTSTTSCLTSLPEIEPCLGGTAPPTGTCCTLVEKMHSIGCFCNALVLQSKPALQQEGSALFTNCGFSGNFSHCYEDFSMGCAQSDAVIDAMRAVSYSILMQPLWKAARAKNDTELLQLHAEFVKTAHPNLTLRVKEVTPYYGATAAAEYLLVTGNNQAYLSSDFAPQFNNYSSTTILRREFGCTSMGMVTRRVNVETGAVSHTGIRYDYLPCSGTIVGLNYWLSEDFLSGIARVASSAEKEICESLAQYCDGHKPFPNVSACLDFYSTLPTVDPTPNCSKFVGMSKACRFAHHFMARISPQHCYHAGDGTMEDTNGKLKCVSTECPNVDNAVMNVPGDFGPTGGLTSANIDIQVKSCRFNVSTGDIEGSDVSGSMEALPIHSHLLYAFFLFPFLWAYVTPQTP